MFKLPKIGRKTNLLLEVLMIVIGINVALWFEGWFQDLEDADVAQQYIVDLRKDLLTDIEGLDLVIKNGEAKSQLTEEFIAVMPRIAEQSPEEQARAIFTPSSYQFFVPTDFTYRSMQASGDFRLLRNEEIKRNLLRLDRRYKDIASMQDNFLQALDSGYIPLMMNRFDIAEMRVTDPTLLQDQMFRNFFVYTKQDTDMMVALYRLARSEAEELVGMIDDDLKD